MQNPSRDMIKEAVSSGYYKSELWGGKEYPKIQILTIEQLLKGDTIDLPTIRKTFKRAEKGKSTDKSSQEDLF